VAGSLPQSAHSHLLPLPHLPPPAFAPTLQIGHGALVGPPAFLQRRLLRLDKGIDLLHAWWDSSEVSSAQASQRGPRAGTHLARCLLQLPLQLFRDFVDSGHACLVCLERAATAHESKAESSRTRSIQTRVELNSVFARQTFEFVRLLAKSCATRVSTRPSR